MFTNLEKSDGTRIGLDLNYLTISGVALWYYYFIKQFLWMDWEMIRNKFFIQLALNGGKITLELQNRTKVTVGDYCVEANCLYEFHGCYYYGCPAHYESSSSTPHRVRKQPTTKEKRCMSD